MDPDFAGTTTEEEVPEGLGESTTGAIEAPAEGEEDDTVHPGMPGYGIIGKNEESAIPGSAFTDYSLVEDKRPSLEGTWQDLSEEIVSEIISMFEDRETFTENMGGYPKTLIMELDELIGVQANSDLIHLMGNFAKEAGPCGSERNNEGTTLENFIISFSDDISFLTAQYNGPVPTAGAREVIVGMLLNDQFGQLLLDDHTELGVGCSCSIRSGLQCNFVMARPNFTLKSVVPATVWEEMEYTDTCMAKCEQNTYAKSPWESMPLFNTDWSSHSTSGMTEEELDLFNVFLEWVNDVRAGKNNPIPTELISDDDAQNGIKLKIPQLDKVEWTHESEIGSDVATESKVITEKEDKEHSDNGIGND